EHVGFLRRRAEWFEKLDGPPTVLWWVPTGRRPTLVEAKRRLELLAELGPTAEAFTFAHPFSADAQPLRRALVGSVTMPVPVLTGALGLGTMARSHALAYHRLDGFAIVALKSRSIRSKAQLLPQELRDYPLFEDFDQALSETRPNAVSINTYTDTHALF